MDSLDIESPKVDHLVTLIEESTRAGAHTVKHFIEPASGTLMRALSSRPHIVFGRRGSGKSSLLRKAYAEHSLARIPTAFVDLETFKGHSYPDVLLSILIKSLSEFEGWLASAGTHPSNKSSFWDRLFGRKPATPPLNKPQREDLSKSIRALLSELEELLHASDGARLSAKVNAQSAASTAQSASVGITSPPLSSNVVTSAKETSSFGAEYAEETLRSKIDVLHRKILDFQKLFTALATLGNGKAFLFLDDLYHIRRADQASVLDYFHRVTKNTGTWLKVGTIRHRTDYYRYGDPPVGTKIGDDVDEIDLDLTLERYAIAKTFLGKILAELMSEASVPNRSEIISDSALDRLVLASGGVARDFLTIFRRSVDHAKERIVQGRAAGKKREPTRIGVEDVNKAAGDHDTSKREEFRRDTSDDTSLIDGAFDSIRKFCIEDRKSNCFLVERDQLPAKKSLIDELVDLKMLHLVQSRTTTKDQRGKQYTAYMLDLSQYTGDRARKGMDLIEFWTEAGKEQLRRTGLILDLNQL